MQEGQIMHLWFPKEFLAVKEPDDICSGERRRFPTNTQVVIYKVKQYSRDWTRILVHTVSTPHWWAWVEEDVLITPIEAEGVED